MRMRHTVVKASWCYSLWTAIFLCFVCTILTISDDKDVRASFLTAPDLAHTQGQFVHEESGHKIAYSFAVDGQTFYGKTWIGTLSAPSLSPGAPINIFYDTHDPSLNVGPGFLLNVIDTVFAAMFIAALTVLARLLSAGLPMLNISGRVVCALEIPEAVRNTADLQRNLQALIFPFVLTFKFCEDMAGLVDPVATICLLVLVFALVFSAYLISELLLHAMRWGWGLSLGWNLVGLLLLPWLIRATSPSLAVICAALFVWGLFLLVSRSVRRFYFSQSCPSCS